MQTYPELGERARGWLHHLWRKATTQDDWSRGAEPHPWWDRYSTPPMTNFPRFDLSESAYAMAAMVDLTPAWREAYTRIVDELVRRHTTFWAAVDWLTQVGHDPGRGDYPEEWKGRLVPEHLFGDYDAPGWTANGVAPWGLQPDPIGSDGNLFFRGFFNLTLAIYRYVSGDGKWDHPFPVAGFEEQTFTWTHPRIAEFLNAQWAARPEGPHCENTKIWPYCLSAAGLGLQLTDRVTASSHHWVFHRWIEDFVKKKYMAFTPDGRMETMGLYYDPLIDHLQSPSPLGGIGPCFYILPQNRPLAELLYEAGTTALGWNDPSRQVLLPPDPRWLVLGLVLAQEFDDRVTALRLRDTVERYYEPRRFGAGGDEFGWWFQFGEDHPRGQLSALLMMAEVGGAGSWWRVFNEPELGKFDAPTVTGVDYPVLGVSQAWNDLEGAFLALKTYAATSSARGQPTRFRIEKLPAPADAIVRCDADPCDRWRVVGEDAIEVETDVDTHSFQIFTGYRGAAADGRAPRDTPAQQSRAGSTSPPPGTRREPSRRALRAAGRHLAAGAPSCPCCLVAI